MKRTLAAISLAVLSISLTAPLASADWMTYNGPALTDTVTIHDHDLHTNGMTVLAGSYSITYQDENYAAYCVDAQQWIGSTYVSEKDVDFLPNSEFVSFLYETYDPYADTAQEAAALGVALWEVLYEEVGNGFDVSSGDFYITGNADVTLAANAMLAAMPDDYTPTTDLTVLRSRWRQDLLIGGSAAVPEPTTVALLVMGLPLMLKARRRSAARAA